MKKLWIGLSALVLVMGIGAAGAYASTVNNEGSNSGFFKEMLPFAKQMHPSLSDEQLKKMVDHCSDSNRSGMSEKMQDSPFGKGMMNF
ncbi:FAD/FMN-containing dehydrogenase [Paenibacillus typhae]|uniref:FAD/FMN-containing dehydrogenase n=1 Tax=Paenibacillus typhae TaxID=1174501 RepID=A0A1G8GHJ7_9BACL|nr:FAD/FMN-containing dehydrogenase [Paenibacillus typhae]SDH93747.1 hypothetical protein SAMN05216192_10294 [Paenibacillus typhae]